MWYVGLWYIYIVIAYSYTTWIDLLLGDLLNAKSYAWLFSMGRV